MTEGVDRGSGSSAAGKGSHEGGAKPAKAPPPHPPELIAPTGSPGVNCVVDVINKTAAPFMSAPPPEQGAAGWVAAGLGGVLGVIGAPQQIIDTAFAALTAPIAAAFPGMPAMTLLGMHIGPPHAHTHPPSLIPPAPPVPLPSIGMLLGAGSVTVLVGGLPAARAGDIGLAVTCGSLAPPFEVYTGSSNVFFGGARAARLGDITKHCNPTSMGAFSSVMGALGVVAGAAGAIATGNAWAGAQAAADAAVLAVKLLAGKDPGIPPGYGMLVGPPVPNVLVGGFPCPPIGEMAVQGLMKALKSVAKAVRGKWNARRGNAHQCNGGEPIYLITGENFGTYVDFVSSGLFRWERHYTTAHHRQDGPLGHGSRHLYQRSLRVRLHKAIFTDWDGQEFEFPRFRKGSDVAKSNGYVLRRLRRGRYQISYRDEPVMEFSGGEYDGLYPLKKLITKGGELELGYDETGRLATFTEWQWEPRRETRYELRYDRDGHVTDLYELPHVPFGSTASPEPTLRAAYAYSRAGDLTEARDAVGGKWRYELDWFHRLVKQTDPNGYVYAYRYDAASRCVWCSGEDGLWESEIRYYPEDKKTVYVDAEKATWEYHYDDDGFLRTLVDPYGGELVRVRDDDGKVVELIDSGGRVVRNLYDADGANVGRVDQFGYQFPTELEAPALGDPFERTLPSTPVARLYDGILLLAIEASRGAAGPLFERVPLGFRQWVPGTFTLRPAEPLPLAEPRVEKDALGRTTLEEDPLGRRVERSYDAAGNLVAEVDADGRRREQRVTSWNLIGEARSAVGDVTRFRYSRREELVSVVDANGNATLFDYDHKDRLVRVSRMGKVRETYEYDVGDRFVRKRDGEGHVLFENEHDPVSHFVAVRRLASGGEHRYRYDRSGNLVEASTERHEVTLLRDALGRATWDLVDGEGVVHRHRLGRGRITRILDRFALETLDRGREATRLVAPDGSTTDLTVDETGLVLRHAANGTQELTQYDDRGRLVARMLWYGASGAERGWTQRYDWSHEGELRRVVDSMRGTTAYHYDAAHRLIGETTTNGESLEYVLDGADVLLSKPDVGRMELGSGNRLLASDAETFAYDARDHLAVRRHRLTGAETRYVYDAFDLLVAIERGGGERSSFEYDALGRRLVARHGDAVRSFVWDGDRLAAEVAPDGTLRIYQYASASALVPVSFTDYASVDAPPEEGRSYQLFADPAGQPLVVQDARGDVVWMATRVDPYGRIEVAPGARIELNLRWPGHYLDPEVGLHYNRYRYYDPLLGRYLQSDPLGYAGSEHNLYGAPTNPLADVDVLGLDHPNITRNRNNRRESRDNDGKEGSGFKRVRPGSPDGKVEPLELTGSQRNRLKNAYDNHLKAADKATGRFKGIDPGDLELARTSGASKKQIAARERVLEAFVHPEPVGNHINGHDLTQPMFIGPPPPAPVHQAQYQVDQSRPPGQYFANQGFSPDELGIASAAGNPPVPKTAFPTQNDPNTPYLQSVSAATYDTWSQKGNDIWTHGGGIQRVYPRSRGGTSWL